MILLIDNYDSFTYNLVQRIGELYVARQRGEPDLRVVRNDRIDAEAAAAMKPSHVIVSPGPCTPREGGVSNDIIRAFAGQTPLLGVCLGHQCIGHSFDMPWGRNPRLMHGKTSMIHHDGRGIFAGLSNPFEATRYHSLTLHREGFDEKRFEITAWTDADEIMGLRARPGGPEPAGQLPRARARRSTRARRRSQPGMNMPAPSPRRTPPATGIRARVHRSGLMPRC